MQNDLKYNSLLWRRVKSWSMILVGSVILSAAFVFFMNPYKIVPGGVYGLGIVLHTLFPSIQVGTFGLMLDIPLLLIGIRIFGRTFGAKTIVAALLIPVLMNLMTYWVGEDPATMLGGKMDLSQDILLVCIFGGVLLGLGVGMIIKTHATSGGTDIVAMILTRYTKLSFSQGILMVDALIVVFGVLVLGDWRLPLYSLIAIFVSTRMIDYVIDGASYNKLIFIVTNQQEEIKTYILETLERGGTFIKSAGMYSGQEREMVFLVVSRNEVSVVRHKIREIDPNAFVVIVNAHEIYGEGFKQFPESV